LCGQLYGKLGTKLGSKIGGKLGSKLGGDVGGKLGADLGEKLTISAATPDIVVYNLAELVSALAGAPNGSAYTIGIGASFVVPSQITIPANKNITLVSSGGTRTLTRAATYTGVLLSIAGTAALTLEDLVLDGNRTAVTATGALVYGAVGAVLSITDGTVLRSNLSTISGGAVRMLAGGELFMSGGEITGNSAPGNTTLAGKGGGIFTESPFIMSGGTIDGNSGYAGGGVNVQGTNFLMTGGSINGNQAYSAGGVSLDNNAHMVMDGGIVSYNFVAPYDALSLYEGGGGIVIYDNSSLVMNDGTVQDNTAYQGGGVYIDGNSSSFTMKGGNIIGNHATPVNGPADRPAANGGGVYGSGPFVMEGGLIAGNDAINNGGGVFVYNGRIMTLTGGEIDGNTAYRGGGVYLNNTSARLNMSGGLINGNHAALTYATGTQVAGGGVFSNGIFTQTGGAITNNDSAQDGGGLYSTYEYTLADGVIAGNLAQSRGGGLFNTASVTITDSAVASNRAGQGGGVFTNNGGSVVITDSTVANNIASIGGGVSVTDGAALTLTGAATILSDNAATSPNECNTGGGVYADPYTAAVVTPGVIFTRNYVAHAYNMPLLSDQAAYNSVVHDPSLDPQYDVAWNNADISYCPLEAPTMQVTFWRNTSSGDPLMTSMTLGSNLAEGDDMPMIPPLWNNDPLNFAGWSLIPDDTCPTLTHPMPTTFHAADFTPGNPANLNVYAIWCPEPIYHEVTFESNGGTPVAPQSVLDGYNATFARTTRPGCTFAGWYTNERLDVQFNFLTPIYEDLRLYAKWDCPGDNPSGIGAGAGAGGLSKAEELAELESILAALEQGENCYNIGILTELRYPLVERGGQHYLVDEAEQQAYLAVVPLTIAEVEADIAELEDEM
jgi:uncharacterized repeat protein (TIGR02543 family)